MALNFALTTFMLLSAVLLVRAIPAHIYNYHNVLGKPFLRNHPINGARHFRQRQLSFRQNDISQLQNFLAPRIRADDTRQGLNFESCATSENCKDDRQCIPRYTNDTLDACSREDCICRNEDTSCTSQSDCTEGELCQERENTLTCVSSAVPAPQLNFASCRSDFDCQSPRTCFGIVDNEQVLCPHSSHPCFCLSSNADCSSFLNCSVGESCLQGNHGLVCVSESVNGEGLNFEHCREPSDCRFPRQCADMTSNTLSQCSSDSRACSCRQDILCTESSDCSDGESCVEGDGDAKICVSDSTFGPGLNFDSCRNNSDCRFPRRCYDLAAPDLTECSGGNETCACRTGDILCTESSDCSDGESCVEGDGDAKICVSDSTFGPGLNFDSCRNNSDCRFPRHCFDMAAPDLTECSDGNETCACRTGDILCEISSDCSDGESCVEGDGDAKVCVSDLTLGPGLNYDSCRNKSDCRLPRTCDRNTRGKFVSCQVGGKGCFCRSENSGCTSTADCSAGESCLQNIGGKLECKSDRLGDVGIPVPLILSPSEVSSSPDEEEVVSVDNSKIDSGCVAVSSLGNMAPESLVYKSHKTARVLCDAMNNCATPGHMIAYEGRIMMMKTYCKEISCSRHVMKVNSPRYRAGLRVSSNTKELEFTAIAARYETAFEEIILATALRLRL